MSPLTPGPGTATQQLPRATTAAISVAPVVVTKAEPVVKAAVWVVEARRRGALECALTAPPCAVCSSHTRGRTFPAEERGSAAGSLLSSHHPKYTWTCVLCRPSPELPFHFVWFLGWSTRGHLALLRSIHLLPCTCNTSCVRILMLFNIFLHPSRSPASSCHSGTSSPLSHGLTRRASLRSAAPCVIQPVPGLGGAAQPGAAGARCAGGRTRAQPAPSRQQLRKAGSETAQSVRGL
jgi:hypothetical protein